MNASFTLHTQPTSGILSLEIKFRVGGFFNRILLSLSFFHLSGKSAGGRTRLRNIEARLNLCLIEVTLGGYTGPVLYSNLGAGYSRIDDYLYSIDDSSAETVLGEFFTPLTSPAETDS